MTSLASLKSKALPLSEDHFSKGPSPDQLSTMVLLLVTLHTIFIQLSQIPLKALETGQCRHPGLRRGLWGVCIPARASWRANATHFSCIVHGLVKWPSSRHRPAPATVRRMAKGPHTADDHYSHCTHRRIWMNWLLRVMEAVSLRSWPDCFEPGKPYDHGSRQTTSLASIPQARGTAIVGPPSATRADPAS